MTSRQLPRDEDLLRQQGQRLTPQRRMVLEIMRSSHGHVTVDDVLREARLRGSVVSVASIYRILSWLTEYNLVCVTDMGGADLAWEYLGAGRHHHLICQRCGTQVEVPYELMEPVVAEIRQRYEFEPRIDHQAIFGICQRCQAASVAKGYRRVGSS